MSEFSYIKEINSIDAELKRISNRSKNLRAQKTRAMVGLHTYMRSHNLEKVGEGKNTITLKKCESYLPNRPKKKAKPKSRKREDAIKLFRTAGIPNPEKFYSDFEETQKIEELQSINNNKKSTGGFDDIFGQETSKRKKKHNNNDSSFDPFLGF